MRRWGGGKPGDFLTGRMCCPLGLHVSLPRCLRLWHRPLPLGLFLGGVQPGALCLPASNRHPPCSHAAALKWGGGGAEAKMQKLKLCLFPPQSRRQIFCPLEKQTWRGLPPHKSCDIHPRPCVWPGVNFDIPPCSS